ncbi:MAG: glycosyltransferase family 2 protein [Caulobacter sp.]|nr:glycosyltransferase family 2 protein [Caulobacter sp.]
MTVAVSIVIPTQRRPAGLAVAMASALRQAGADPSSLELVIADNDQVPSAQAAVEATGRAAPFPVVYVHEPAPGVANVRNRALSVARGALVAFLDDDQEAPEGWLADLLRVRRAADADVVFGPVHARAPEGVVTHRAYFERFFSRLDDSAEGAIAHFHGCGNSLIRRGALPSEQPFSVERNTIGGEDDLLFGDMRAAGKRFAWAPGGWVWEDPVPSRLTLKYTLARAFGYGQGPTEHCWSSTPRDMVGVVKWMLVGLAQTALFGPVALVKWALRRPDRAQALDRAARGLGKTFWWGPFRLNFYGRTA